MYNNHFSYTKIIWWYVRKSKGNIHLFEIILESHCYFEALYRTKLYEYGNVVVILTNTPYNFSFKNRNRKHSLILKSNLDSDKLHT